MTNDRAVRMGRTRLGLKSLALAAAGLVMSASPGFAQQPTPRPSSTPRPIAVSPPAGAPMSFADLIERVSPAVVSVSVVTEIPAAERQRAFNPFRGLPGFEDYEDRYGNGGRQEEGGGAPAPPEQDEEGRALGSGFFISPQGYIVTNNHVIEHAREVVVQLKNGDELECEIVGRDEQTDLAVLKVRRAGTYPYVEFSTRARPRVGDWVVAVGNPFGLGGTATAGIVSADSRQLNGSGYNDFIQVDAPINRGNSGGPTFDLNGRVIGVNTAIFSDTGGGSVGIGFAIEASAASRVVETLIRDGKVVRGWLGVEIQAINPQFAEAWGLRSTKGAVVSRVTPGGPAATGGIRERDVIVAVNDQAVDDNRQLTQRVGSLIAGTRNSFKLIRDGREMTLQVTVRERDPNLGREPPNQARLSAEPPRPSPADVAVLGGSFRALSAAEVSRFELGATGGGLLVVTVDRGSPLRDAGIGPGDAVLTINDKPLRTPQDLQDGIAAARRDSKSNVVLQVACGDGRRCRDGTTLRPVEIGAQ
jgi:serine protease Do